MQDVADFSIIPAQYGQEPEGWCRIVPYHAEDVPLKQQQAVGLLKNILKMRILKGKVAQFLLSVLMQLQLQVRRQRGALDQQGRMEKQGSETYFIFTHK